MTWFPIYVLVHQIQELPPAFSRHTLGIWIDGSTYHINPANFFRRKACNFYRDIVELLPHIWKCPKTFWKHTKIIQKILKIPNHLRNWVQGYHLPSKTSSLLKIGEVLWKNCHLCTLLQSIFALSTNYTFTYYIFLRRLPDMAATTHTFKKWREKLVHKCDWAWNQSFRLAGVRLAPRVRELAGIPYSGEFQDTKKFRSDSPRLVNFAVGLVDFIFHLPDGQVKYSW